MRAAKKMILFTLFVSASFAYVGVAKEAPEAKKGPCKKIIDACKIAGLSKTETRHKKGLFKNCFRPVMRGETVPGIRVSSADIEACRAKKRTMPNFK